MQFPKRLFLSLAEWCYPSQQCHEPGCKEPRKWMEAYSDCGGENQSPINIVTNKVEIDWNLKPLEFLAYQDKQKTNWTISNTGHSVKVTLDGSAKIKSGGLPDQYKAVQFHFHWGRVANSILGIEPGSEHTVDGERYPMELHIVHIKEQYANTSEAASKGGIAVLGFFIEIGDEENKNYNSIISKLKEVSSPENAEVVAPSPLLSLIPPTEYLDKYYRYHGSLTTPSCSENVIWTLFEQSIKLSLEQVRQFPLNLHFKKNSSLLMEDNFRPVQPLGKRTVYKSDAMALVSPAKTLLLLPAATYLLLSFTQ
ncbi:carbonic anhydrase 4 [Heteronotia binoei]|uniref:carbonic anhydrase 4 n=1 Tax=Heteronotia binoei TaxID=13085 RepID=UPI00292FCCE7|nr:carbonic anhydrase 4 [Heteronotia binoei]